MAMMMTGRVLLVCALCVLWCGAWLCDAAETSSSAPHRDNAEETTTPEEVTEAIEKLAEGVLDMIRVSCRMSFITSVNATLPAHNDTEVEKCVNKTAVEISGVTPRGRPAAATTDATLASPLPSSSSATSALQGQAQGSPGAAPEPVKPPQTDSVNTEQLSETPASTGGGELADRSSHTPTDVARTHEHAQLVTQLPHRRPLGEIPRSHRRSPPEHVRQTRLATVTAAPRSPTAPPLFCFLLLLRVRRLLRWWPRESEGERAVHRPHTHSSFSLCVCPLAWTLALTSSHEAHT
ncbi:Mucin-associated surface protein (MASP) [Trypanosoma cruzi]|uniref:Mucin-associated surface protein (MASP) n=1 Tax=Trypanosoma cruzi TaxID=5693 RepID=A0A2V2XME5_TRYCR|nr:Mucin-associated surface protein (MASP) [Trypanosoma cruzi]